MGMIVCICVVIWTIVLIGFLAFKLGGEISYVRGSLSINAQTMQNISDRLSALEDYTLNGEKPADIHDIEVKSDDKEQDVQQPCIGFCVPNSVEEEENDDEE